MLPIDTGIKVPQVKDNYLDPNSLNSIKDMGRDRDPQAIKEVAKKFEGLLVQQMLKSMREANDVFAEGNFMDSQTTRFHRDMLDQQMVINLTSGTGMGLADHFYQQMMKNYGNTMRPETGAGEVGALNATAANNLGDLPPEAMQRNRTAPTAAGNNPSENRDALDTWVQDFLRMSHGIEQALAPEQERPQSNLPSALPFNLAPQLLAKHQPTAVRAAQKASVSNTQENFVMMLKPHAEKAAAELNINPDVLIAQVALETGWGKHVIHDGSGNNSFNLFNIKATSQWQGDKVNVNTLEYRNGIAAQEKADFRKYQSYADSFSDYVRLMKNNPRYEQALAAGNDSAAYADALQRAGYATDPAYAQKIKRLLNSDALKTLGVAAAAQGLQEQLVQTSSAAVATLAANLSRQVME